MNLLASVLPGLRELRAPLASGALWLAALSLGFYQSLEKALRQLPIASDAKALFLSLPPALQLGVLGFAAFLIGVINERLIGWIPSFLRRVLPRTRVTFALSPAGVNLLLANVERRFSRDAFSPKLATYFPVEAIIHELDLALMHLATRDPVQYGEIDRLKAESQFRYSIIPPILAFVLALFGDIPVWILILIVSALVLLAIDAAQLTRRANDRLASAIHLQYTDVPVLEMAIVDGETRAKSRGKPVSPLWLMGYLERYGYTKSAAQVYRLLLQQDEFPVQVGPREAAEQLQAEDLQLPCGPVEPGIEGGAAR